MERVYCTRFLGLLSAYNYAHNVLLPKLRLFYVFSFFIEVLAYVDVFPLSSLVLLWGFL